MKKRIGMIAAVSVVLCGSSVFGDYEMVTNGTFDIDLSGWILNPPVVSWVGDDGDPNGDPNVGCIEIGLPMSYAYQWVYGFQAGETYHMSYSVRGVDQYLDYYPWVRFTDGVDGTPVASEFIYQDNSTVTNTYYLPDGLLTPAPTEWTTYELDMIPGAGATHLYLRLDSNGGSPSNVRVDSVSIISPGAPPPYTLGPELVTNGAFDTDATGWNVYLGEWLGTDGDPNAGCVALNQGDANAYVLQYVPVEGGKTYRFSYRFSSPDGGMGAIWCYPWIRFEDDNGDPVASDFTWLGSTKTGDTTYFVPNDDHLEAKVPWQTHELDVTAGAGATKFRIQFAVSDSREFRFDSFSLREIIPGPFTCQDVLDMGYSLSADLNSDCYVNWQDFTVFAGQWLDCIDPNNPACERPWEQ